MLPEYKHREQVVRGPIDECHPFRFNGAACCLKSSSIAGDGATMTKTCSLNPWLDVHRIRLVTVCRIKLREIIELLWRAVKSFGWHPFSNGISIIASLPQAIRDTEDFKMPKLEKFVIKDTNIIARWALFLCHQIFKLLTRLLFLFLQGCYAYSSLLHASRGPLAAPRIISFG